MREIMNSLPNILTAIRILLLPLLWLLALLGQPVALGWVLLVAFFTDAVDGPLARMTGHVTAFGSKFDSIADALLGVSSAIWLVMFQPDLFTDNLILCIVVVAFYLVFQLIGLIKFRRLANLHLYSTKIMTVVYALFAVHALITGQYNPLFFTIVCVLGIIAALEGIFVFLTRDVVDEHIGTILIRPK
jgi:phosphatidylglycerophosphate synthase